MEILKHESDLDITHKLNNYELQAWLKHLNHIKNEIDRLEKMWNLDLDDGLENNYILQQLEDKRIANDTLLVSLKSYVIEKPNSLLCEDYQCDLDIISEHENHRDNYLTYLKHYRVLKNNIFRILHGKPIVTDNRQLKYG